MAYIDKSAIWAVKEEPTYAGAVVIDTNTDYVELIEPTMDGEIERVERETLKNSLVSAQSLLGKEMSSGSLALEVATTNDSGELNGDVLYKSGMGVKIDKVTSETPTANTATTIDVADGSVYTVGGAVKVTDLIETQFRVISGISGNTLTVSPDLGIADDAITSIEGVLSYTLATPSTAVTSFTVQEYLEDDSARVAYTYKGNVVGSMNVEFPIANIVKASFDVQGAGFNVDDTIADESRVCATITPHIAKNMTFNYGGTDYDISDLSLNVENDISDIETVTSFGINNKIITGKSTVGGSFNLEYEGKALFELYKANTAGILTSESTASNGKKFGVFAPKVTLQNVSKSIDDGVYKDNVDFECLSSDACLDGVEDALTIWFE